MNGVDGASRRNARSARLRHAAALICALLTAGCGREDGERSGPPEMAMARAVQADPDARLPLDDPAFKDYWFSGNAEISRYRLKQARYGEIREGDAVLIFVTEDFLPDRQVKSESPDRARTGAWLVMKLNQVRKFTTGIYPYTLMTSVFTPLAIDRHPRTLKTSTSAQEWCGHTYLQLNLRDDAYRVTLHSYFEPEGDRVHEIGATWLEDELMTRIRLAPGALPTGELEVVPGGQFSRLRHRRLQPERAHATLIPADDGTRVYQLDYTEFPRTLRIRFGVDFPHPILGWEETYPSGFGEPEIMTTRAVRTHTLQIDYWNRNANADREFRAALGLSD